MFCVLCVVLDQESVTDVHLHILAFHMPNAVWELFSHEYLDVEDTGYTCQELIYLGLLKWSKTQSKNYSRDLCDILEQAVEDKCINEIVMKIVNEWQGQIFTI